MMILKDCSKITSSISQLKTTFTKFVLLHRLFWYCDTLQFGACKNWEYSITNTGENAFEYAENGHVP